MNKSRTNSMKDASPRNPRVVARAVRGLINNMINLNDPSIKNRPHTVEVEFVPLHLPFQASIASLKERGFSDQQINELFANPPLAEAAGLRSHPPGIHLGIRNDVIYLLVADEELFSSVNQAVEQLLRGSSKVIDDDANSDNESGDDIVQSV